MEPGTSFKFFWGICIEAVYAMNATKALKKQERTYLLLVLGVCYLLGMMGLLAAGRERNPAFDFLQKAFTAMGNWPL